MKSKSGIIWRLAVVVAMVLALVPVLVATPALASPEAQDVYLSPTGIELNGDGEADWSDAEAYSGSYSAHLDSVNAPSSGDEARVVIPLPAGMTLGDIESISWLTNLVSGYIPHVDLVLDLIGEGERTHVLTAEGAYQNGDVTIGFGTGWIQTFEGADGTYPGWSGLAGSQTAVEVKSVQDKTAVWCGEPANLDLLSAYKVGKSVEGDPINFETPVLALEIEVDSWVFTSEAYVDDVTINGVTYDLERHGTAVVPVQTTSLDAGSTYDLNLLDGETTGKVTLSDVGTDLLPPAGEGTSASVTLSDGEGTFYSVEPLYASAEGAYILLGSGGFDIQLPVLASDYEGVSVSTTATSFKVDEEKIFTVTVTKDGAALAGATVDICLDDDMDGEVDTELALATGFTTSAGTMIFTVTPEEAGQIIPVVSKDIGGGLLLEPDDLWLDGVMDIRNTACRIPIDFIPVTVTTQPTEALLGFDTDITVIALVGTNPLGGADVTLEGCDIAEDLLQYTDGSGPTWGTTTFLAVHPDSMGTIKVTVSLDEEADGVPEYYGLATIAVVQPQAFNVSVAPATWVAAVTTTDLRVTIQGIDAEGPDGPLGPKKLNWAKVVVSVPVGQTLSTLNWVGGNGLSKGDATSGDLTTLTFEDVLANDASSDITVTVTGMLDGVDGGTAVGPVVKTIPVSGYMVSNIIPDANQSVGGVSDISMTVTTKEGFPVNNALVTITAERPNGFQKDIDADPEAENFQTIEMAGASGLITYGGLLPPEPFMVNGGFYEVTGIGFAQVGLVEVKVQVETEPITTLALFRSAFSVLGLDVYDLSFDVSTLTAGVDGTGLEITITEDGTPVIDVAEIVVNRAPIVEFDQTENVYTVMDTLRYTEETTILTVMATNADRTKYGTATLPVGLPSVTYVITEEVLTFDVERDLMLVGIGNNYTIAVTALDALGEPLAVGSKVWLGTYLVEEDFTGLASPPADSLHLVLDGDGSDDLVITQTVVDQVTNLLTRGLLVWKVGDSAVPDETEAALVLEGAITVALPSYTLTWDLEEPMVGQEITFTVEDNYGEPADERVDIVTPAGDVVEKQTTPGGTFKYTGEEAGVYWIMIGEQLPAYEVTVYTQAALSIADLVVAPTEGEAPLTISASADVTNSGQATGDLTVYLKVDGEVVDSEVVSVDGNTTVTVTFGYELTEAGTYLVTINDLTADEVTVLAPAELSIANLDVAPTEGEAPLTISASADVTNSGDVAGDFTAHLKVDGVVVDSEVVSVDGNTTVTVTFSYTFTEAETYLVTIDDLTAVEVTVSVVVLTLQLYEGANPILYEGATTDLPAALNNISDLAEIIWQRDVSTAGEWWYYHVALDYSFNLTELENGKVYIVVVSEDCIWQLT